MSLEVEGLYVYPIKSCAGVEVESSEAFQFDRFRMVVDTNGNFLTQREIPRMALIITELAEESIIIRGKGESSELELPLLNPGPEIFVSIWGEDKKAINDGPIAKQWFSDYLGVDCDLVHIAPKEYRENHGVKYNFADSEQLLITSEESRTDLNNRIVKNGGNPVPMNRFRPNIVLQGLDVPYDEDTFDVIDVNGVKVQLLRANVRCPIPQIEQSDAIKGKEPIRTLLGYRRVTKSAVVFGQKSIFKSDGVIYKHDPATVDSRKEGPIFIK